MAMKASTPIGFQPWPPEFSETLKWQWMKRLSPTGSKPPSCREPWIKLALEPHPDSSFIRRNIPKLHEAIGKTIGVNFDPSHFFWQGVDISLAIRTLGETIFHVHAKDIAFDSCIVARNGVLDNKSYSRVAGTLLAISHGRLGHDELEVGNESSAL